MDCTGSMASYIESARNNIRAIVEEIVISEKSDIRMALVEYRDHPPQVSLIQAEKPSLIDKNFYLFRMPRL